MSLLLNECKLPSIYDNNNKPKLFTSSLFLLSSSSNNNSNSSINNNNSSINEYINHTNINFNNNNNNNNNNIITPSKNSISSIINNTTTTTSTTTTSTTTTTYNKNNNNNVFEHCFINNNNNQNNKNNNNNQINININDNDNNDNDNDGDNNSCSKFRISNLFTDNNYEYNNSYKKSKKNSNKKKDPFNIYQVSNSFCLEVCGVTYDTLIFLWTFIKNNNPPFEANSYQLVWALNWLKDYSQVREGASKWSVGKDLFQKAINNIISFLGSQLNTISLNERHIGTNNTKTKLVIDILFVETQKPSDKETQSLLYSKKHQKYGYKFECCVRSYDGLIVWFKGPFPGSAQLLSILDSSRLLQSVDEDEKILAKQDYIGISKKFEFPLKESHLDRLNIDELLNYEQQNTYCQILDNTISFMKKFRFCCDRIRTKGSILEYGIRLIANIHNLELENKPPIQCLKKKKLFI